MGRRIAVALAVVTTLALCDVAWGEPEAPHLRKQGTTTQLLVDGKPFLILGGELHNSSSSSLEYMEPIWPRMLDLHLNTVLAPVSWELVEPEEGHFDFALVDGLVEGARRHGLRLVFLWFGSWKNGRSSYVPEWVKSDERRFPRARVGKMRDTVEILSTLEEAARKADATAFAAFMRHLREIDRERRTVLMVQVENEVGLLGDTRDRAPAAEDSFAAPVPERLLLYLEEHRDELVPEVRERWRSTGFRSSGSWKEVFGRGEDTDEIFMAWHYARYLDRVAEAGKAEYEIPVYANAWLGTPGRAGDYPSGGPLPHVLDIWLAGAPHIDLLAPDIYSPDFDEWCERYTRRGNPLFIPEMRRNDAGARNVFSAFGAHGALGTSPFAVDGIENPAGAALAGSYAVLAQIAPLILQHQGKGTMVGFLLDEEHPRVTRRLGAYELEITLDEIFGYHAEMGYGLIIALGPDEFLGAGGGFRVTFAPDSPGPGRAGIVSIDEGVFRGGHWLAGRRLNGDENDQGRAWRFDARMGVRLERCRVYRYE
jgi:beta-galactosidase GanA